MSSHVFKNVKMTKLLAKYAKTRNLKLRDEIIRKTLPLVDAAISRKRLFHLRDDLRQECVLKILTALPKFDPERGSAFAFLWTTICNVCVTQAERNFDPRKSSLEEEGILREAETTRGQGNLTPECHHILKQIASGLDAALNSNGQRVFRRKKYTKALLCIKRSIASGEFFESRGRVISKLSRYGFGKKEANFLTDYALITIRTHLYHLRDLPDAIGAVREIGKTVPEVAD